MSGLSRRTFLASALAAVATAATGMALGRKNDTAKLLRVGVMANLTHAPMLAGLGSGRIAQALAPVSIESRVFRAGPRVTEALIGDAIDVGTSGPAPVVVHHARHASGGHGGLRILGGCCSGGASLVVTRRSRIAAAEHLRGKSLAVTQIGTTQDLALRSYLAGHALKDTTAGGDVRVIAVEGATILAQMKSGELDGAWLPEPWATRVVHELDAVRFIDERDLWPERRFSTAVLVARGDRAADASVSRLAIALDAEVARALRDPKATRDEAYAELTHRVGNPGKRADFDAAWAFMDFTSDPVRSSVEELGRRAKRLEIIPESASIDGLFP
ncbi:MAG: sulfonate transport system substrate-binding protein [Myxococcales bacterium]|jgi:NitT/TauT family transport system substrate-binding protein|nr:sulfonate transport system substrate-binding protein [Myxococcales bacterium]